MKQFYKGIDFYNEIGEILIDDYLIPAFKTGKNIIFEELHLDKINKYKRYKSETNIKKFINDFRMFSTYEINEKLNKLDNEEKEFLLDIVSNVIDLNDRYQILVLSYLAKEFIENQRLIFWQKSLYYNIKTLSENDFMSFIDIIETSEEKPSSDKHFILTSLNKEQEIVKDKFINLGILHPDGNRMYGKNINFQMPEHAVNFYNVLKQLG
ncbi:hypothetical protein [Halarcobacter bivalviorum]|uniref:hypothetical protein n=1 Tax=Halarcobacter bivalviorum TaxID=663364 RepID=UPI00100ADAFD|nr:hypothetical protein [Halarcobacter bivalviorum]RXK08033.1 hypothetical protein CRU97_01420 [Halarcobacter bivalviorum]